MLCFKQQKADMRVQVSTYFEAPTTITQYSTLPGATEVIYSTIESAYTSTVVSVQPGRTIYETMISSEEGATLTTTLNSVKTVTCCTAPVGPATGPLEITYTRTLPGATSPSVQSHRQLQSPSRRPERSLALLSQASTQLLASTTPASTHP
jgi:hypothetical protein